jgi:two-component system sensor histidine kinase BaeS
VSVLRTLLGFVAVVAVGLAWLELSMQPTASERAQLLLMFAVTAAVGAAAAFLLPSWAARSRSLRLTVTVLSMTGAVIVGVGVGLVASQMFLSSHDLRLVFVALGVAVLAGTVFALAVAQPWTRDLARMAAAADRVAVGDFTARSGVNRHDEIGHLAEALDSMAAQLAAAEEARRADEAGRREFLAAIGHDLRTPLAALRAALEALRDGVAPDPARYLQSMEHDVAALSALVDDLFLLAKIESGALEIERGAIDVTEVADEAIEVLRPVAAQRDVRLRLSADDRVVVEGGAEALSRVIRNLLDNAIRHAPVASEVLVRITDGEGALVEVCDAGPGFAPEFVHRAFGSFTRADPARGRSTGGAGLGLAIAEGFVAAMGGTIWAEPGPGGRVAFRLPTR